MMCTLVPGRQFMTTPLLSITPSLPHSITPSLLQVPLLHHSFCHSLRTYFVVLKGYFAKKVFGKRSICSVKLAYIL